MSNESSNNRAPRKPLLTQLSTIHAKEIPWLFKPYLAANTLSLLSGAPGASKTSFALAIAASLSRGEEPFSKVKREPANVLYCSNENAPAYVTRPAFNKMHGNPERLFLLRGVLGSGDREEAINLSDEAEIGAAIKEVSAKLLIVDPIASYLTAIDMYRANETRPILDGLIRLAEDNECCILLLRHLTKGSSGAALNRGSGSIDITGAARSELFMSICQNDPSRRIMSHGKSNLGILGPSLAFGLEDGDYILLGEDSRGADELLTYQEKRPPSALEEAADLLKSALATGPRTAAEITQLARDYGVKDRTLSRARVYLGVQHRPDGYQGSSLLELPSHTAPS